MLVLINSCYFSQLNFTVEEKITGQGVEVDTSEISKGDSVTFTVSAESGQLSLLSNLTLQEICVV